MPLALIPPASPPPASPRRPASNDNGRAAWCDPARRRAARAVDGGDAFWGVVRGAVGGEVRVDYLAAGVLRVAGAAPLPA